MDFESNSNTSKNKIYSSRSSRLNQAPSSSFSSAHRRPLSTGSYMGSSRRNSYPIKSRNIGFSSSRNLRRRRTIFLALCTALLLIFAILLVRCIRFSLSSHSQDSKDSSEVEITYSVSSDLLNKYTILSERQEKLDQIMQSSELYENEDLIALALAEPEAIDFVYEYPSLSHDAQAYTDEVIQGQIPDLWVWDTRWGAVEYAGAPLALTGSGPCCLSAAYMYLTGKSDMTPADFASLAEQSGEDATQVSSYMASSALTYISENTQLICTTESSYTDNLNYLLSTGYLVLIEAPSGTVSDTTHWILAVLLYDDGSVKVFDPTSKEVSDHAWAASTLAACSDTLYGITSEVDESGY